MTAIEFEAEKFANTCFFKDELVSEIRKGAFKKGAELIIEEVEKVHNEIYNKMPTGTIADSFELIKIIKNSLDELDVILNMK